jgi:hypothetical protein
VRRGVSVPVHVTLNGDALKVPHVGCIASGGSGCGHEGLPGGGTGANEFVVAQTQPAVTPLLLMPAYPQVLGLPTGVVGSSKISSAA